MGAVLELAERAWQGELEGTQVHPGNALLAFEELAPRLGFLSAFSNVAVVATDAGLVLLDTSSLFHARRLFEEVRRWSDAPVHTAVYSHGHVDHVFGLGAFEQEARESGWPRLRVLAHERCPERFARYRLTQGWNAVVNQRQFGFPRPVFPTDFREPDETLREPRRLEIGGTPVALHPARGETDDHVYAWLPEQRTLYTGDLFIWASPNCGNPQKVQRYPREWAAALRQMQALGAERLLPGHGPPILGAERVRQALDETAELLEILVARTLELMNQGARLDDVLHGVRVPERLLARPYLRPTYDDPRFILRNLWRLYGGWWDGNPANLLPAPEADLARALAQLSGGAHALAAAAERAAADARLDLACHLIELAARAAPTDARVHAVRARIYTERRAREQSLMAQGIFGAAARESAAHATAESQSASTTPAKGGSSGI
jgi:glyoxylase-like metal-dependent hydrolase (beta-lactamase superfamily II)